MLGSCHLRRIGFFFQGLVAIDGSNRILKLVTLATKEVEEMEGEELCFPCYLLGFC